MRSKVLHGAAYAILGLWLIAVVFPMVWVAFNSVRS